MAVLTVTSHRIAIGLLLAAALLAYANAFTGAFQFDDTAVVLDDPHLANLTDFGAHLDQAIRPLVKLTFLFDRRLYGDQPTGYHLLNLLFHLGSGLLLYGLLRMAVRMTAPTQELNSFGLPFWTALLFLIHPIGTETVTYISGRPTGMMTFFYLAAFSLYVSAVSGEQSRQQFYWHYGGALLCFVLALLCKEAAVTLPITLLLWELIIYRRSSEPFSAFIRRRLPAWLPFLGILFLAAWAGWSNPRYAYLARHSLELRPFTDNLLSQINVVAYALFLFVWPARLTFDHDFPVYHSILEWPTPASLALLIGLLVIALLSVKQRPLVSVGLLWFFLTLAPTNSVIPRFDLLSERNLYLPSIGVFMATVALLDGATAQLIEWLATRTRQASSVVVQSRRVISLLPLAVSLLFIVATHNRNLVYVDQVTFWSDAVSKSPGKARAHNNAGYAYQLAGDLDRAIDHFRAALALNPDSGIAGENLRQAWELRKNRIEHQQN